ncbi:MAG TPA: hypothetical protein VIO61_13555 [Anaerolineaceae bacterium]
MNSSESKGSDAFSTILAILISLVALSSAILAWQAALAADTSSNENAAGITAAINLEETRMISSIRLSDHLRAYTNYARNITLGNRFTTYYWNSVDEDHESYFYNQAAQAAYDEASISQYFLVTRYLNQDGTYNANAELGESYADAARRKSLDPNRYFANANRSQVKASGLTITLVIMAAALWFYTVALGVSQSRRYIFTTAGSIAFLLALTCGVFVLVLV